MLALREKPWIAFKVLGAGVVKPRQGFELALRMGADFLAVGMFDFQVKEDARKAIPMNRFGDSHDVAQTVAFLASEECGYVTGQVVCVDGGMALSAE